MREEPGLVLEGLCPSPSSVWTAHWRLLRLPTGPRGRRCAAAGRSTSCTPRDGTRSSPYPLDVRARSRTRRTICSARDAVACAYPQVQVTAETITEREDVPLLASADGVEMLVLGSRWHSAVAGFLLGSAGLQGLARAG